MHSRLADPGRDTSGKTGASDKDRKKRNGPLVNAERLGQAFIELIEALPAGILPTHAASSVAMTGTIDFTKLTQGLGVATLANDQPISRSADQRQ